MEFRHFFFGGSPANFLSRIHLESNRSLPGIQLLHLDNMESTSEHSEYEITQQDPTWSPHGSIAFNCVMPFIIYNKKVHKQELNPRAHGQSQL